MSFHPYLFFCGNCGEAFNRYHEIFGGELFMMKMSDAPADAAPPGVNGDLVMHAALKLGDGLLMASDDPTGTPSKIEGVSINYGSADAAEIRRVFDALADGGEVTQPLIETFFSPSFGTCVDRFGIPWMLTVDPPQE